MPAYKCSRERLSEDTQITVWGRGLAVKVGKIEDKQQETHERCWRGASEEENNMGQELQTATLQRADCSHPHRSTNTNYHHTPTHSVGEGAGSVGTPIVQHKTLVGTGGRTRVWGREEKKGG